MLASFETWNRETGLEICVEGDSLFFDNSYIDNDTYLVFSSSGSTEENN